MMGFDRRTSRARVATRALVAGAAAGALALLPPRTARADEGMWTFDNPPVQRLKEVYNFTPDSAWFDHVRMSSVRFNSGGSGPFVSANGLVMTNHHVGMQSSQQLSAPEQDLRRTAY